MNVDFLFLLAQQQQAGGGGPQFVGAAPATQVPANGSSVVVNVGTAISGIQDGDYVVAVWASASRRGANLVFNTGAGLVGEPDSLPSSADFSISPGHFVKGWTYSSSSPSLSVTNSAGTDAFNGVLLLASFRSVQVPAVGRVAVANGGVGDPNPPSLSSVEAGSIVLAIAMVDDDAETFTAPSGFTIASQGASANIGATADAASAAIAYQTASAAGAVDPASFSIAGDDAWFAYTVELRAAP